MNTSSQTLEPKPASASEFTLNTLMMPTHANPFGNVHGGVVMKLVDEAAAMAAMRHARQAAVTVAIDSMSFREPVHIGDLVTCKAKVTFASHSAMEIAVTVHAENPVTGERSHTNSAYLVFIAIGPDKKPTPVPPLLLSTAEESAEFDLAKQRQAERLARRQQEG